jgi:hypothetical protein
MIEEKTKMVFLFLTIGIFSFIWSESVEAVPSFKRQTGMSCTACHTMWPELTPFGRVFKMDGYTFSKASENKGWQPPIAAMVQLSYTDLNSNNGILKNTVAPFDDSEDSSVAKFNFPQQASLFYGGRIIDHLGAFSQLTYSGPDNDFALDNTDIRYARTLSLADKSLVLGSTINNSPTVQDVWNNLPTWSFPYATSDVAPTPAASAVIDGGLDQQVGGIGAYVLWNNLIYAEGSVYRTTEDGITRPLGAGTSPDTIVDGAVPYWRVALQYQWGKQSAEIGTFGLKADIYPGSNDSGPTNQFTDIGMDAQYQYISEKHLFGVHSEWISEDQDWDASFPKGATSRSSSTLDTFKIDGTYAYKASFGIIGGSIGYFDINGDTDTCLYGPEPVEGSRTGSPDSRGFILEADYIFKDKYKFSAQYTIYDKFNGASSNYDGFGRDASDNNTIYLLVWLMF